ncbi:MAG: DNA-packaging protein [Clostridiales bacterium]|nr:DNA-packaging protein [Clostridiales bacterium]
MLDRVKLALLISSNDFDDELEDLIGAAVLDLNIAGVDEVSQDDKLVIRAICSYCGYQFELMHGTLDRANAFKKSYDEQKAQLGMATNYTTWAN